ncbi:MAG: Ig-like domain-containing protein [Gemmatimonadota bacterium]|nr:Ig-like domain-containing protein [Gemmatimonadota bacterium]MDE3173681.1 Ig-like domain-containing protein [Gemmatimonadota bacterium]MDE3215575.1 Ig-like domain-containing protein [Gemmatimonadota bacterium]
MPRPLRFVPVLVLAACTSRAGPSQPPPPEVKSVAVGPAHPTLAVGQTLQLADTAYDAQGRVVTGLTVTWTSANRAVATVDQHGVVRGVGPGQAQISATVTSATGTLTLQVTP